MDGRAKIKRLPWYFVIGVIFLSLASPVQAFEPREGDRIVINEGEVIEDDLYVTARVFILNGTIKGDLLAAGSAIVVGSTGVVEGDLIAGGQGVTIDGTVEDDVRMAGAVLSIGDKAIVGGDVVAAGYSLETKKGSTIEGDLVFYGAQASLSGNVAQDLKVGVGGLQLSGQVGGDVNAEVGESEDLPPFNPLMFMPSSPEIPAVPAVSAGLNLGESVEIGGDLTYTAAQDAKIPSEIVRGSITRKEPPAPTVEEAPEPTTAQKGLNWFIGLLRNLITLLIIGLLLAWLVPDFLRKGASVLQNKPWLSLLWGIVVFVAFFIILFLVIFILIVVAAILGLITLGDLVGTLFLTGVVVVTSLLLVFNISIAYVSKILVCLLVGMLLLGRFKPEAVKGRVWPLVLGVVLFGILASLPILGWIINALVVLFGLGALWLLARDWFEQRFVKSTQTVPEVIAE